MLIRTAEVARTAAANTASLLSTRYTRNTGSREYNFQLDRMTDKTAFEPL
jgi:hypothetical protein